MNVPTIRFPAADELAPQLAEDLVAALVGPDAAAVHAAELSENPIARAWNPTAGRCAPVSSTDPVRSKIAAR